MTLTEEYKSSLNYWQAAFSADADTEKEILAALDKEEGLKEIVPSEKLYPAAKELGGCKKVLDYGCGHGWAGLITAKSGCPDVTAVDITESAARIARELSEELEMTGFWKVLHVDTEWIDKEGAGDDSSFLN